MNQIINETVNKSEPCEKMMSPTIGKLATALSKAQGQLSTAKKDSDNPFFKSKYADLESVWEACREALTTNKLAVIQTPEMIDGKLCLVSMLTHSSGEWIRSELPLMLAKQDPQSMGSAITYARRYALASLVGVVQSDDDGEAAMKDARKKPTEAPKAVQNKVRDISLELMEETLTQGLKIENKEHLSEYLVFVKKNVKKPMRDVLENWMEKPEPFKEHYKKWVAKKFVDKNSDERYTEVGA